jgi:hypothetical protein
MPRTIDPARQESATVTDRRRLAGTAVVGVAAAVLVLVATRHQPALSNDSITYLSTATNLRRLDGFVDFSGDPMTVFGPLLPLVLMPGARALWWARIIGAGALAGCAVGMIALLRHRVGWLLSLVGAAALVGSALAIRVAATVWTEVPYMAIALAAMVVATRPRPSLRVAVAAGALAGAGVLTRYGGVALVAVAALAVGLSAAPDGARVVARRVAATCATTAVSIGVWVARNLFVSGTALGPRFEGGMAESLATTFDLAFAGAGTSIAGDTATFDARRTWGVIIVVALAAFTIVAVARLVVRSSSERWRRSLVTDVVVGSFGLSAFLIPVWTRTFSANDIEARVMSPVLLATVYIVVVTVSYVPWNPATFTLGAVAMTIWCGIGVNAARTFPERVDSSLTARDEASAALLDAVDRLPDDAVVLSNSPQRVWWHTDRDPVQLAFIRERPGNSHQPLDIDDTLAAACTGEARLAWFTTLRNAGGGPEERRPDLADVVRLEPAVVVDDGVLYELVPIDPARCAG